MIIDEQIADKQAELQKAVDLALDTREVLGGVITQDLINNVAFIHAELYLLELHKRNGGW